MKKTKKDVNQQNARPADWSTLFANETELAKSSYNREQDRHKMIMDKAKVTFVIAGLTGAYGINRADVLMPAIVNTGCWETPVCIGLLVVSYLLLAIAVVIALDVLRLRKFAAASDAKEYVQKVQGTSEDVMNRTLADIYERTAAENSCVNDRLATQANRALVLTVAGFIAAILFFGFYGYGAFMRESRTLHRQQNTDREQNIAKRERGPSKSTGAYTGTSPRTTTPTAGQRRTPPLNGVDKSAGWGHTETVRDTK